MNIKLLFLALLFNIFLLICFFCKPSNAYVKDQQYLVPLEKEILLKYVNQNCHENHKNWEELINDGRVKCKPGPRPVSFKTLSFVKHYSSGRSSDIHLGNIGLVIVLFIIFSSLAFLSLLVKGKIGIEKKSRTYKVLINSIFSVLVGMLYIAGYDLYKNHIYYYIPHSIDTIFDAVEENDLKAVRRFVKNEQVNPNEYKRTFVHFLPSHHRGREIKKHYVTALDIAANRKHYNIARYLSYYTPEINSKFNGLQTQLKAAAASGNHQLVSEILKKEKTDYSRDLIPKLSPLHYAVCAGNNDVVKLLLDHNVGSLDQSILFRTPIDASIWCNNTDAMEMLLEKTNKPRHNPIESALAAGNIPAYMILKMKGYTTKRTLEIAAKYENYKMLKYLNSTEAFNNLTEKQRDDAISEVTRLKALKGAVFLYKIGLRVDLNLTDSDQSNILITAAKLEDREVVKKIVSAGFDKSRKDRFGYTAFDYSISTNNEEISNILKL